MMLVIVFLWVIGELYNLLGVYVKMTVINVVSCYQLFLLQAHFWE